MKPHPDGTLDQFDNRMRIMLTGLDRDAFPPALRDANPLCARLWDNEGADRLLAFIRAPDAVQQAIWAALLEYEGGE